MCELGENILDVGESENIKERIKNHERSDCWKKNYFGPITYFATYIYDEVERRELERVIRHTEDIACGEW